MLCYNKQIAQHKESCATLLKEVNKMKVNELWSLENVADYYEVIDESTIINTLTGKKKKATKSKVRGYWYYTLQTKDFKQVKVYVHKINALAFIENRPYELIEHINDDKDNNSPSNLKFSNQSANSKSMYKNGKTNHYNERRFRITDKFGNTYEGTTKEIVQQSNGRIPRSSIYYLILNNLTSGRKISYVEEI